jgi:glutamate/tyrosine decarboxylase-like PLP-dependent enzyme
MEEEIMEDKKPLRIVDPRGRNRESARQMGYQIVDLVVDHLSHLDQQPVLQQRDLPAAPPQDGHSWREVLLLLQECIIPGAMQVAHPRFFGHMDSGPLFVSMLADFLTSALNQNMLLWELSPLATAMEQAVITWLCQLSGLPETAGGTLVSGGTAANLTGLLLARQNSPERRVILASDQVHYSVAKVARVLGLGIQNVLSVPTDSQFRLLPSALATLIERLPQPPLAMVATAGTTSTGSVDPLADIAAICHRYGVYLHVDAAHGGSALLSPTGREKLSGIDQADSIALDPHKWMLQPKSMGVLLVRNPLHLQQAFGTGAPYLARTGIPMSQGQFTLQGSRRWDALRLWVAWQYLGEEGFAALIDHTLRLTAYLAQKVGSHPQLEVAHDPDLNVLCFRLTGEDIRTEIAQKRLIETGIGFVSLTTLRDRRWFRTVLLNPSATEADIDTVLAALTERDES